MNGRCRFGPQGVWRWHSASPPRSPSCRRFCPRRPRHPVRAGERFDHVDGSLPFGGACRLGHPGVHYQPVTVLHQQVAHVAELGGRAFALSEQQRIRVGLRLMGVPAALLATEVHRGIATAAPSRRLLFILGTIALERGQGLDQRAIHAEVFFRQQIGGPGLLQYLGKELVRHLAFKQPIPVLRESRVMPDAVVHRETFEPAEQQVSSICSTSCRSLRMGRAPSEAVPAAASKAGSSLAQDRHRGH